MALPRTPRNLQSKPRRQVSWTLALVASLALASAPAVASIAHADDLNNQKNKAHQGVKSAQADLEDSSKTLSAAYSRLRSAKDKLVGAQRTLARTQGELTAAKVLDAQMQAKLVAARAELEAASSALAQGRADVKEQRADLGRLAASNAQLGDPRLLAFAAVLNARDPNELAVQFHTIGNLQDKQTTALDRFRAAEALLVVRKNDVAAAKALVLEQRQAAAVNLARRKVLERQAVTNQAQVAVLVTERRGAAAAAQHARAVDLFHLRVSKRKEARIKRLILARAAKHHGGYRGGSNGFLYRPVPGYVTSPYGYRVHPIYGYYSLHDGIDFHAPCGTPERAGAAGTVISEYYSDVWGNRLYLDVGKVNGHAMTLIYNHISSYRVHQGAHVSRGEVLAYAGTTGWSTACHLHFTVMIDGTPVNPQKYL